MPRGHNELVGLQVRFSRVCERYRLVHLYQWRVNGKKKAHGTLRGYDMCRHLSIAEISDSLRKAYAPAILSIWRQVDSACYSVYFQFDVGCTPLELKMPGVWEHWAEQ